MLSNQLQVQFSGQQRSHLREPGLGFGAGFAPAQGDAAQVPDPRGQLHPQQVEQAEVHQRDTVGVGGVLGDRQIRCVAEDFVEYVVGFTFGGDDDLGAVGGVLVGDVGVGRQALFGEIAAHRPRRRRPPARREPLPITGRQRPGAEHCGQRQALVVVDQHQIGRAQGFLAHIPVVGPGQDVVGDAAGLGHPRQPEVGRVRQQYRDQVAFELRGARGLAAAVGEAVQVAGAFVQLDQQRHDRCERQHLGQLGLERDRLGRNIFRAQRRDDQIPGLVQAHRALTVSEHGFQLGERAVQLLYDAGQGDAGIGGASDQTAELLRPWGMLEHTFTTVLDLDLGLITQTEGQTLAWFSKSDVAEMVLGFEENDMLTEFFAQQRRLADPV